MSKAFDARHQNVVMGKGELYIERVTGSDSDGLPIYDGAWYAGDSPAVSLSIQDEVDRVQSSDSVRPTNLATAVRSSTRTISFSTRDASDEAWSYFIGGLRPQVVAAKGNVQVADEKILITSLERWYQLGRSAARPEGAASIVAGQIDVRSKKAGAAADAYAEASANTMGNYFVDPPHARIYVPDNQTATSRTTRPHRPPRT